MIKKVTLLQLLIDNGVPIVAELFDEYKEALVHHVTKVQEVGLKLRF
jgi:hypothetical protein